MQENILGDNIREKLEYEWMFGRSLFGSIKELLLWNLLGSRYLVCVS